MIKQNISLKELSHYKIGGKAKYFVSVASYDDIIRCMKEWRNLLSSLPPKEQKYFILGDSTNILFDDQGYAGLIIHNQIKSTTLIGETEVKFGSGLLFSQAVGFCSQKSLTGLEWAGGLPGTVGGAVRGNAGAFGHETKDTITSVQSINLTTLERKTRDKKACCFDYRTSIFKTEVKDDFITSATFKFTKGESRQIIEEIKKHVQHRKDHQPLEFPSVGSTFKNVDCRTVNSKLIDQCRTIIKDDPFPVIPVAYLLTEAGLKGEKVGEAEISEKHPNFIINLGKAKSSDVIALINLAQKRVLEKFNIDLEPEIIILNY